VSPAAFLAIAGRPDVVAAIKRYAIDQYPFEMCGAITPDGFAPLRNVSPLPAVNFDCNDAIGVLSAADRLLGLVHSHPDGPFGPSDHDMRQQIAMDIPWGLVACDSQSSTEPFWWHDGFEPPPLEGRQFRHGPSGTDGKGDCYALVRDYYRMERGILLPEFPRTDNWWARGDADLYRHGYAAAGFRVVDSQFPEVGDIGIVQIGRTRVPNHAVIYVGSGRILHHLTNNLSVQDSFAHYAKSLCLWIRHYG
jgi:proteasome lid subunit RPN8/RPN11